MYELVFILPAELDEQTCNKSMRDIIKTISKRNGALVKDNLVGEKLLQYPIKGSSRGKYYLVEFTIPVDHLNSLNKDLNLRNDILRFLISKKEPEVPVEEDKEEKEKVQAAPKDEKPSKPSKSKPKKKEYTIVKSAEEKVKETKDKKTTLDDLDKKLDEILE